MCLLLMTFVPVQNLVNLSIRMSSLHEFWLSGIYIYIHRECRSVLVNLYPITVYRTDFGECAVSVLNATCCFLWFHQLCLAL